MDQSAELPFDLDQDFNDLLSILRDDVGDLTPPPAPSHPFVPAGMDGCTPLGAAPHRLEQLNTSMAPQRLNVGPAAPIVHQEPLNLMQPGPLYNQAGSYSQGQYNYDPVVQDLIQDLPIFGVLNGQVLYELPQNGFSSSNSAAPPPNTVKTKKRKRKRKREVQHHDGPYVKKPPNAFMLFMKEQRPNFETGKKTNGMGLVNTILGQKWQSLSDDEQEKYYQQADIERQLHAQHHPDWSSRNNYGVKRKRDRRQAAKMAEASTSGEVTQQAKKLCVTSVCTGVVEAPPTHTYVMEPSTKKTSEMETVQLQRPYTETLATVDVSSFIQLLDDNGSFCLDSTTTASTAMESPAAPEESGDLDFGDLDLAKELEALVAGLMEPLPLESLPQPFSLMDIFPEEDQTEARWCDPWLH